MKKNYVTPILLTVSIEMEENVAAASFKSGGEAVDPQSYGR